MEHQSLTDRIAALAEPLLASLGLVLWGIEYYPGTRAVARLYIERAEAPAPGSAPAATDETGDETGDEASPYDAGIDECAHASRLIGLAMEVEDFIPSAYVLEVSTPGLERRFFKPAQLAAALGRHVEITLLEAPRVSGRKKYAGRLLEGGLAEEGEKSGWLFRLELDEPLADEDPVLPFAWSGVKKARQIYDPPLKLKPGEKPGGKSGNKAEAGGKPGKKSDKKSGQKNR